ncbi:hypothetical protein [Sorangium sp. So ce1151]|uniref:hypothetical protein n=1 Tax=Sorangium sp. So ce1151 TaxID=3133332 RepID=UPI003F631B38
MSSPSGTAASCCTTTAPPGQSCTRDLARFSGPIWGIKHDGVIHIFAVGDIGVLHLHGVWGTGRNDVFVVGDLGAVLNHDGESWSPLRWDAGQLSSVWGASPGNVLFAGEGGRIVELLRTAPAR